MSKIEIPFHIDENAEFRFALVLESRSVEAHSLMDSGDNREDIRRYLESLMAGDDGEDLKLLFRSRIKLWKDKYKG